MNDDIKRSVSVEKDGMKLELTEQFQNKELVITDRNGAVLTFHGPDAEVALNLFGALMDMLPSEVEPV